ncbi:hypothetical protein ACBR40_11370 [Nonomuraea sp. AD125B]|uniref:hypothetical protein n=1 Tax=Nonomuraea sp. AD125B TaxID=3242897 RepID=UPI003528C78E
MRTRRYAASVALACAAAISACTAGRGLPTLDEATSRLAADADLLLRSSSLRRSAPQHIDDGSCAPGEVRGSLRAESERVDASSGLREKLQAMGYAEIADDLDLRDGHQDVTVLRDPRTLLTFELTVARGTGVRLVGSTTCYAAS